jgi:hypothetical protein
MEPKTIRQLESQAYNFIRSAEREENKDFTHQVGGVVITITATKKGWWLNNNCEFTVSHITYKDESYSLPHLLKTACDRLPKIR